LSLETFFAIANLLKWQELIKLNVHA